MNGPPNDFRCIKYISYTACLYNSPVPWPLAVSRIRKTSILSPILQVLFSIFPLATIRLQLRTIVRHRLVTLSSPFTNPDCSPPHPPRVVCCCGIQVIPYCSGFVRTKSKSEKHRKTEERALIFFDEKLGPRGRERIFCFQEKDWIYIGFYSSTYVQVYWPSNNRMPEKSPKWVADASSCILPSEKEVTYKLVNRSFH